MIASTGQRRRNEGAGCRRGGETESRESSWPAAWLHLHPSAAVAADARELAAMAAEGRRSRMRKPLPRRVSSMRVCEVFY